MQPQYRWHHRVLKILFHGEGRRLVHVLLSLCVLSPDTERRRGGKGTMRRRFRDTPTVDKPLKIVLADDDSAFRRLLGRTLRQDGHEVVEASNGSELLRCLTEPSLASPLTPSADLVITDICMPGLSGLEALAAMEHADYLPPFIVMTAFGSNERHEQARALGAAAVLEKPFSMERLRREVGRHAQSA